MAYSTLSKASLFKTSSVNHAAQLVIKSAQQTIVQDFWQASQTQPPELVLALFQRLFINHTSHSMSDSSVHLYGIVMGHHQDVFNQVVKSVCCILINAWQYEQQPSSVQKLLKLIEQGGHGNESSSAYNRRLRLWLQQFCMSPSFLAIKANALGTDMWWHRYQEYLLIEQSNDAQNLSEHQASARQLAQQIKSQYQSQLAKYASSAQHEPNTHDTMPNPTRLGRKTIVLIKRVLLHWQRHRQEQLTARFCQESAQMTYGQYKKALFQYLSFATPHWYENPALYAHLEENLARLDTLQDHVLVNQALERQTVETVIDWLTLSTPGSPSRLFIQGVDQGNPLLVVMLLLKLVLISPKAYLHLDARISALIHCYAKVSEEECRWLIHFLELFRMVFAIFTGQQHYTLINTGQAQDSESQSLDLRDYRIFAQQRL
jgi:hypothetical protein